MGPVFLEVPLDPSVSAPITARAFRMPPSGKEPEIPNPWGFFSSFSIR